MINYGQAKTASNGWMEKEARLGDLIIHLGKSPTAPDTAEFRPSRVMQGQAELWHFDKSYIGCFAVLREVEGEWLIVYATRSEVVDVIPLLDLPAATRLAGGQYDWRRSASERLTLKMAAAELMRCQPRLTPVERVLKSHIDQAIRAAAAAAAAAAAEERAAEMRDRNERREARRRAIMNRAIITGYTATGDKRRGRPVTWEEWQVLRQSADCILVERYEEGVAINPTEYFFVNVAPGGRKSRTRVTAVYAEDPTKPKLVERQGQIAAEVNGQVDVIDCYTADGLAQLEAGGLNSGAIRALSPANPDGSYTLVEFARGGRKSIGNVQPIN